MKFKTRLYIGLGSILLFIILLAWIGFQAMHEIKKNAQAIVNDNYAAVRYVDSIRAELNNISREFNLMMVEPDSGKANLQEHLNTILESQNKIGSAWDGLSKFEADHAGNADKALMSRVSSSYSGYLQTMQSINELYQSGKNEEAKTQALTDAEKKRKQLFALIRDLTGVYESKITDSLAASERTYWNTLTLMGGVVGLIILSAAAVAWWVFRGVTGSLEQIAATLRRVSYSEPNELPRIDIVTQDEVGHIAAAFNQMASALERQASKEAEYQMALREQAEHKSMVADIFASYQGVQDLRQLAELFTNAITPLLGASYAAFYAETDAEQTTHRLFKVASYAAQGEELGKISVARGEGLVGQCALERKMIVLHDVPEGYVRIGSGLGSAAPLHLLLMPVSYEGRAVAVLEFASFQPFGSAQLAVLEEVASLLGIAVSSANAYSQIQRLLRESQTYAEELQTQSEELQLQQEELRVLNEQLEVQYKDTDRRNQELEHVKKELESKNEQVMLTSQYKTEFLANVSHELRTPLNSLLLLTQLLAGNSEGNLHPKQIEYLRTIHSAGTDLHNLINDILDMSKMESGKMELVVDSIGVQELASTLEQQFAPLAAQKGLRFETQVDAGSAALTLCTDVYKAQQILKNLLSNALKFTEQGVVTIAFRSEADGVAVAVSDTGIGIPENKQEMVFEAFRQADGTTSRKFGGTGLGLFISQEIADLLGGRITLMSKEGEGSTFTLWLPLTMPEKPAASSPDYPEVAAAAFSDEAVPAVVEGEAQAGMGQGFDELAGAELKGKKVLLVDDDMRNIFALTGVLESFGMHVLFAENGQEGLDMLALHPDTDLILMDIMMPVMDGYEAMRAIRASELPHRQLPIIALTAKAMKHDREMCIEAGASDYITKPIQTEQLVSLLRVWLHR